MSWWICVHLRSSVAFRQIVFEDSLMSNGSSSSRPSPAWRGWALMIAAAAATFLLGLLAASILERRQEAAAVLPVPVKIGQWETDSAKWGEDYPREYESYKRMADSTTHTKYGGADQRDYLKATPANVILFAGYGFSKDYKQARACLLGERRDEHAPRQHDDASHLFHLQEPRRAADDARVGRAGEVLRPEVC